jgi:RNA polymerase sigma-70 factor, ECF subfamily
MRAHKFNKIVREYKNLIYNQALYSTGNRYDAADITQDVLIKAWNHMDDIQPQSMKPWLLTVTRNSCVDMSRKKRERNFSEIMTGEEEDSIENISTDGENDPEQSLDQDQEKQQLISAIAGLPEKIRTTMILRYMQDEPYDLIAETLGLPINSIKVYLHRGRKLLAQKLRETREK